jgi:hypothetical protein
MDLLSSKANLVQSDLHGHTVRTVAIAFGPASFDYASITIQPLFDVAAGGLGLGLLLGLNISRFKTTNAGNTL